MTQLYKIINDEEALINFIKWLPDLKENETYYLSLFARKKYCQGLIKSNDKTQLKRFTANKQNMLDKIKQLEIPLGRWKLREIEAPQESLVLYILPNPRCMKKATEMMGQHCWNLRRNGNFNLVAEAMSCVQKSKSRACFVDFDIDTKENIDFSKLNDIFPYFYKSVFYYKPYTILETKNGYHLLVVPDYASVYIKAYNAMSSVKIDEKWYKAILNAFPVDHDEKIKNQNNDKMIPVPGCTQGGFTPKFIKI